LRLRRRTCLHIYKYYRHPASAFGTRLQTWFPFNIQIWLNGREWLAQQLAGRGYTEFRRHDKAFTWVGDPALARHEVTRLGARLHFGDRAHSRFVGSLPGAGRAGADQDGDREQAGSDAQGEPLSG
jgi:hypothetical protein